MLGAHQPLDIDGEIGGRTLASEAPHGMVSPVPLML
jgi:hypothetical protein